MFKTIIFFLTVVCVSMNYAASSDDRNHQISIEDQLSSLEFSNRCYQQDLAENERQIHRLRGELLQMGDALDLLKSQRRTFAWTREHLCQELKKLYDQFKPLLTKEHETREETRDFSSASYTIEDEYKKRCDTVYRQHADAIGVLREIDNAIGIAKKQKNIKTKRAKMLIVSLQKQNEMYEKILNETAQEYERLLQEYQQ